MIYLVPNTENGVALANTLRDGQIAKKLGALLVREDCDGENPRLLEKILVAVEFNGAVSCDKQPWKPGSIVILVGEASAKLDEFEAMCPGFKEYFGPVTTIPA